MLFELEKVAQNEKGYTRRWFEDKYFKREQQSFPASAIYIPDGVFPFDELRMRFKDESQNIDQRIANFVIKKLDQYNLRVREKG